MQTTMSCAGFSGLDVFGHSGQPDLSLPKRKKEIKQLSHDTYVGWLSHGKSTNTRHARSARNVLQKSAGAATVVDPQVARACERGYFLICSDV